jgi:hypothetical protein
LLDLLRGRGVARHDRRGVARRQTQEQEDEDRDDQQDRNGRCQPPRDELNQLDQFFVTFQ